MKLLEQELLTLYASNDTALKRFFEVPHTPFRGRVRPGGDLVIDWNNPVTQGLSALIVTTPSGDLIDLVNRKTPKVVGTTTRQRSSVGPARFIGTNQSIDFEKCENYDIRGAHTHFAFIDQIAYGNYAAWFACQTTNTTNGWEIRGGSTSTLSDLAYTRMGASLQRTWRGTDGDCPTGPFTFSVGAGNNLTNTTPHAMVDGQEITMTAYSGGGDQEIGSSTQELYVGERYDGITDPNFRPHIYALWNNRQLTDNELKVLHENPWSLLRRRDRVTVAYTPSTTTLAPTYLREESLKAPALLIPRRQPIGPVRLDKTHPYTKYLVGCWPMWEHTGAFVRDLTGNNHGYGTSTGSPNIAPRATKYGRGLTLPNDNTNGRISLGSIDSNNPLSCNVTDEISIFAWATIPYTPNSSFPRIIDKSNGGSAAGGWAWAMRWAGATAPDNTLDFYVNANDWTPGDNALGSAAADYQGVTTGIGVVAASGSQEYIWKNEIIGSSAGVFTIPTTTTNAALLNWNHTTDRQWGDQPMYYVAVWDHRLDAQDLVELSFDPYQIFIPA